MAVGGPPQADVASDAPHQPHHLHHQHHQNSTAASTSTTTTDHHHHHHHNSSSSTTTTTAYRRLAFVAVCTRGAGITVFDYAHYSETLLGIPKPYMVCAPSVDQRNIKGGDTIHSRLMSDMIKRFGSENVLKLNAWPPSTALLNRVAEEEHITDFMLEKWGGRDGVLCNVSGVRNMVHATVIGHMPHGDVYARVSSSVSGNAPIVPIPVRPPPEVSGGEAAAETLREPTIIPGPCGASTKCPLIPKDATVFCRHGGQFQFNIKWAQEAVVEVATNRSDLYFVFLTTNSFCWWDGCPTRNLIHLPTETDKHTFIRSCDALLHARKEGETFGLAVADFATQNKPVLTANISFPGANTASAHWRALGGKGLYYWDKASLIELLLNFDRADAATRDWRAYSEYNPADVMRQFQDVFLDGKTNKRFDEERKERPHHG